MQKRLILVAKFTIAASLVVWLVLSGRLDFGLLASVRFSTQFLLLLALTLGSLALPALRWWWLLRMQKLKEPLWDVTALTWLGYFTALVLPGAASADLARSYLMVRRQPAARARAFSTILVDRFVGFYSLVAVGVFGGNCNLADARGTCHGPGNGRHHCDALRRHDGYGVSTSVVEKYFLRMVPQMTKRQQDDVLTALSSLKSPVALEPGIRDF